MPVLDRLIDAIYPPQCAGCMTLTDAPHGLCPACWVETSFITGASCGRCGTPLPGTPEAGLSCDACLTHPPAWDQGRAAALYDGTARRVILSLKHGDRLDLSRTLASWLARAGHDLIEGADIVAPVPIHWRRLIARKYNQSAELARQKAVCGDADYCPDLLHRLRHTRPHEGLDRQTRFENQRGSVEVHPRHHAALRGRSVLLIDDVMTTGATLSACAKACQSAGAATVNVLVLARVARGTV